MEIQNKLEDWRDRYNEWYFSTLKRSSKFLVKLAGIIIGYSIMSFIFMSLYEIWGFERTLILLLVGVFWYGIRR